VSRVGNSKTGKARKLPKKISRFWKIMNRQDAKKIKTRKKLKKVVSQLWFDFIGKWIVENDFGEH
jgi:hypothetical protein